MSFCNERGCFEFAQETDPTCANTLKYKCPQHEAEAKARGETGKRADPRPEYSDADKLHYARQKLAVKENERLAKLASQQWKPAPPPPISPPPPPSTSQRPPQEASVAEAPPPELISPQPLPGETMAKPVEEINDKNEVIGTWGGAAKCAKAIGIAPAAFSNMMSDGGKHGDRRFRFAGAAVATKAPGRRGARKSAPPPPRPSSSPPLRAQAAPESLSGDDNIIGAIIDSIVNMAVRAPGGELEDVALSMSSHGTRVSVSAKLIKVSVTPAGGN